MNVALILSGGVGRRFSSSMPKQYHKINGKAVIDYVIEACLGASSVDKILVVCDKDYTEFSKYLSSGRVDITNNGKERYDSLNNGIEYIKKNYNCTKLCIFDAVAPLVYPELIDNYFNWLDENDCVITCQKITGELGNYNYDIMKRDDYYITQSPESFRFDLLVKHFDPSFYSTELANQLPKNTKRYLNFDFKQNFKITYDFDLKYVGEMIKSFKE